MLALARRGVVGESMETRASRPFRSLFLYRRERERSGRSASVEALPAAPGAAETAGLLQRIQGLAQTLILDGQRVAELGPREDAAAGQQREHLLGEAGLRLVVDWTDHLQMDRVGVGGHQIQMDRRRSWGGAMLADQQQAVLNAPQIEVRVAEGMQVSGAAQ